MTPLYYVLELIYIDISAMFAVIIRAEMQKTLSCDTATD